ncbi:MAG: hypothetical protein HFI67_01310 [Lachnospiraceae bacterium]|jgi:putative ABC transport system permease protein|nr:hypothetical protein [Lachnospiraceae bacterium]
MKESNQKITLLSYDDLRNDSAFYEGQYRLVSGDYIAKNKKGAVINSMLADSNGLELGDDITIENTEGKKSSLKIIGLFLSGSERKQKEQTDSINRIENQVFEDHESYSQLLGDTGYSKVSLYCKNPEEQITRVVNLMFVLTLITGIVIVSLLLCMWMRTRRKETAVFISMGKPKYSIFLQVFLESFVVFFWYLQRW